MTLWKWLVAAGERRGTAMLLGSGRVRRPRLLACRAAVAVGMLPRRPRALVPRGGAPPAREGDVDIAMVARHVDGVVTWSFGGRRVQLGLAPGGSSAVGAGTWTLRAGWLEFECHAGSCGSSDSDTMVLKHASTRLRLGKQAAVTLPLPPALSRVCSPRVAVQRHADGCGVDWEVSWTMCGGDAGGYSAELRCCEPPDSDGTSDGTRGADRAAAWARAMQLMHHIVVFDGGCAMCNASVQFLVTNDTRTPPVFALAAAEKPASQALLADRGVPAASQSSVVVLPAGGATSWLRSAATLGIGTHLRQPWPVLATAARLVPPPLRDGVYDWIARNRIRWFGRQEACRDMTADEAARYLPGTEPQPPTAPAGATLYAGVQALASVSELRAARDAPDGTALVLVYAPWCTYCRALEGDVMARLQASSPWPLLKFRGDNDADGGSSSDVRPGGTVGTGGGVGTGGSDSESRREVVRREFGVATFPTLVLVGKGAVRGQQAMLDAARGAGKMS